MAYGLSFMPGADSANGSNPNDPQRPAGTPVQSAIKLLSLRLPSVVGAQAISPQALLQSPGSAGVGGPGGMGGESLIEWLKKLLQQSQAQMPPQLQSGMSGGSPTFGGPDASSARVGGGDGREEMPSPYLPGPQPRPSAPPPPRVTPGDDAPGDIPLGGSGEPRPSNGARSDLSPVQAPVSDSPWAAPGRNPKLAEKYGFDVQSGNPFDL